MLCDVCILVAVLLTHGPTPFFTDLQSKIEHHMLNMVPGGIKLNGKLLPNRCSDLTEAIVLLSAPTAARSKNPIGAVLSTAVLPATASKASQPNILRIRSVKQSNPLVVSAGAKEEDNDMYSGYETNSTSAARRVNANAGNYNATSGHEVYRPTSGQGLKNYEMLAQHGQYTPASIATACMLCSFSLRRVAIAAAVAEIGGAACAFLIFSPVSG